MKNVFLNRSLLTQGILSALLMLCSQTLRAQIPKILYPMEDTTIKYAIYSIPGLKYANFTPQFSGPPMQAWAMETVVGNGHRGHSNGSALNASLFYPTSIVYDSQGNMFISENLSIRKVSPGGIVSILAGDPSQLGFVDGQGQQAKFNLIRGLAIDKNDTLYAADLSNHAIRKISPNGYVTTLAGNGSMGYVNAQGTQARFWEPTDVVADSSGNVFVADNMNNVIRKINPQGLVTTYAGGGAGPNIDGQDTAALFAWPNGLAIDKNQNIYVSDFYVGRIRKISPSRWVSTIAGGSVNKGFKNGIGTLAQFNHPKGLCVDKNGYIFVADEGNNVIRLIKPNGEVSTLAGNCFWSDSVPENGNAAVSILDYPNGITIGPDSNLYVAEYSGNRIRKIYKTNGPGIQYIGKLPSGMSFNSIDGSISGTPDNVCNHVQAGIVYSTIYGYDYANIIISVPYLFFFMYPTSSTNNSIKSWACYPNPANDIIYMQVELVEAEHLNMELLDLNGRVVYQTEYGQQPSGIFKKEIPTENLANGMYLIRLHTAKEQIINKVVVSK